MTRDEANLDSHVNSYLENLELIYRHVNLYYYIEQPSERLDFLREEISNSQNKGELKKLETLIDTLSDHYYCCINGEEDNDRFFQCLIVKAPEEISSKAVDLHTRFFPNQPYLENVCEHNENAKNETIALLSNEEEYNTAKESSELSFDEEGSELSSEENDLKELHTRFFPNLPYFENVCEHNENAKMSSDEEGSEFSLAESL